MCDPYLRQEKRLQTLNLNTLLSENWHSKLQLQVFALYIQGALRFALLLLYSEKEELISNNVESIAVVLNLVALTASGASQSTCFPIDAY